MIAGVENVSESLWLPSRNSVWSVRSGSRWKRDFGRALFVRFAFLLLMIATSALAAAEVTLSDAREFAESQISAKFGRLNTGEIIVIKNSSVPDLPKESGIFSFTTKVIAHRQEGGAIMLRLLVAVRNIGGEWRLLRLQESIDRPAAQIPSPPRSVRMPDLSDAAAKRQLEARNQGAAGAGPRRSQTEMSGSGPEPSPQQATILQRGLRAWFAGMLAPAVTLPEPPLSVVEMGRGFRVGLPLVEITGRKADKLSANIRRIGGTRWEINELRLPSTAEFSMYDGISGGRSICTLGIAQQTFSGVLDVALASDSRASLEMRNLKLAISSTGFSQQQHFAHYTHNFGLLPVAGGRVDFVQEGRIAGWSSRASSPEGPPVAFSVRTAAFSSRIEGLSRARFASALEAIRRVRDDPGAVRGFAEGPRSPTRANHLRELIDALRNVVMRFRFEETLDDAAIDIGGVGRFTVDKVRVGMGAEVPAGDLRIWLDLEFDRPGFDGLPPHLKALVPTRIALRPAISGINTERAAGFLQALATGGIDSRKIQTEFVSLVTDRTASVGLESFTIQAGAFRLDGSGRIKSFGSGKFGFEARLSATGLDQLISRAGSDSDSAALTGFLVLARGLSRMEGNRLSWVVVATPDKVLVNGVDIQQAGGAAGFLR